MTDPSDTFSVKIDWTKDGDYLDVGEDVTKRVRGGFSCSYGREQPSAVSPSVAGRAQFDLDNTSRDYSPRNASSPLFGLLKPARPVLITRVVGATTYTLFRGHTDDGGINPSLADKKVTISSVDYLADFRGITVSTPLHQGVTTGVAIGYVLDAVGWTGGRDIDAGSTFIPYWWEEGTDAFEALQRLVFSEGAPALLTVDSTGAIVFRDRQHRLLRARSNTNQGTWRGQGGPEPIMADGFTYNENWAGIVNSVNFSIDERKQESSLSVVWSTDDTLSLSASEVRTLIVQASDPFLDAVTPVATVDYLISVGSLTSITISRTSGLATTITLTASGSGCTLAGMALRAFSVPVTRTYQVTATSSSSITDYGQRALPSGQEPYWASLFDAQDIAQLLIAQRSQPLPELSVRFSCQHTQLTRLTAILGVQLSDRYTVIEPETQISSAFFVESTAHNVASVMDHEVVFGMEGVPTTPVTSFVLDTSTLNGATTLAY